MSTTQYFCEDLIQGYSVMRGYFASRFHILGNNLFFHFGLRNYMENIEKELLKKGSLTLKSVEVASYVTTGLKALFPRNSFHCYSTDSGM